MTTFAVFTCHSHLQFTLWAGFFDHFLQSQEKYFCGISSGNVDTYLSSRQYRLFSHGNTFPRKQIPRYLEVTGKECVIFNLMDYEKHFHLSVFGQLETIFLPLGCDSKSVYCRYEILAGPDWELVSGAKSGITQTCSASWHRFQEISFNMPLDFTYKSTNPFGCKDFSGISLGFSW